jgi:hypothetical protein
MLSKVLSCIVCEGVRQETGGKATIFGFAGILPDVKILVSDDNVSDLCLLISTLGEGEAVFTFKLVDPSNVVIAEPNGVSIKWDPNDGVRNVVLSIRDVNYLFEGNYTIVVFADAREVYKGSFQVRDSSTNT